MRWTFVSRFLSKLRQAIRYVFTIGIIVLVSAALGVGAFEWWLRSDPSRMGRPLALAQADFYPYLGIENLYPWNPDGVFQREFGYHKGQILYQHRKTEQINFSGDRFQRIFQLAPDQTPNPSAFRIFVVGSSVAHAGNVPLADTYFSKLQALLKAPYPIQVVAAGKGGASSTEELILFTLSVLPNRPDMIVILDGWNDYALSSILGVRPGDPFNASVMYSKHYDLAYNVIRWLADRSLVAQLLYQKATYNDLAANLDYLEKNVDYRKARIDSLVSVYLHNVRTMVETCVGMGIPVLLVPQPAPDLLLKRHGDQIRSADSARHARILERVQSLATSPYRSRGLITESYEKMLAEIEKSPRLASRFVNIQESVQLDNFVDFVHMDATGQSQLAGALASAIRARLPAEWSPTNRDQKNPPWP